MRLRECVPLYLRHAVDLSPSTVKKIGYEVTRWERLTLGPPVESVQAETFADFRRACLDRGLASRSIESNIDTVRLLMRFAAEAGAIDRVPPVGRRLKKPRPKPSPLSVDELRRLWIHADAACWPNHVRRPRDWWRAFLVLGYWTGLRLSDLCWKLDWQHFSLRNRMIAFPAGKTGHVHEFPIPDRLLIHLTRVSSSGVVLNPPHSMKCFRRELSAISQAAGIGRGVTAKMLRQTAVSEWSKVSRDAGKILHGCGLGDVRDHYVNAFDVLTDCQARVPWPFPDSQCARQLKLF